MSQCYNIVCPETRRAIWVGQSQYLYNYGDKVKLLAEWLHAHEGKAIYFVGDGSSLLDDVAEKDFAGFDDVDYGAIPKPT